ncbi:hypothetical protein F4775DRAFT_593896 [Biscogniauxia sp. FL1348]|nr:hypothetical protein F4775DRAFT_593896 [Biscogniauxia sp. FL1348]
MESGPAGDMSVPFHGQPSFNMELPHWEEDALKSHEPVFRHVISDFNDMRDKEARYLSIKNKTGTQTDDIPQSTHEHRNLVHRLWIALYNTEGTVESESSDAVKTLIKKPRWSEGEIHLALWKLLEAVIGAQRGICSLPRAYTTSGPVYQEFDSFYARFESVEKGLRISKALCRSVLCMDLFIARIAWNPTAEANRKSVNLALNMGKNTLQAIGLYHANKDEITRDENGNLVDQEGNIIPQNTKHKATPALKQETSNTKKRKRPSTRARINKRMEHQVEAPNTAHQETRSTNQLICQATPSTAGLDQEGLGAIMNMTPQPPISTYNNQPPMQNYGNQSQVPRHGNNFNVATQPEAQDGNLDQQWGQPLNTSNLDVTPASTFMESLFDFGPCFTLDSAVISLIAPPGQM